MASRGWGNAARLWRFKSEKCRSNYVARPQKVGASALCRPFLVARRPLSPSAERPARFLVTVVLGQPSDPLLPPFFWKKNQKGGQLQTAVIQACPETAWCPRRIHGFGGKLPCYPRG